MSKHRYSGNPSDGVYIVYGVKNTHLVDRLEAIRTDHTKMKVWTYCAPDTEKTVKASNVKLCGDPKLMTCPKCSEAAADRARK